MWNQWLPVLRPVGVFLLTWVAEPIGRAIQRRVDKWLNPSEKPKEPGEIIVPPDVEITPPQGETDMQKWLESIWPFIAPLLAQQADGSLPEPLKRFLYNLLLQVGTEGQAWVKKTQTHFDDTGFDALIAEAQKEWTEYGHPEVPGLLDSFVAFKTA